MASATKRKIHQYSEAALEEALYEIRQGLSTIRAASRKFGVPRGTLQDRIHGRVLEGPRQMGPDAVLTVAEENKLVQWIKDLVKCGFPRKVEDLLNTVQNIILDDGRKNPFKNGRPGKKWYASFLRRNPGLEHRVSQGVSKGRAIITEEAIRKWFKELKDFLKEHDNLDILEDPSRILNGDETSFSMCPKTGKVIAPRGWKNVYQLQQGNDKETITVLLVFSASGKTATPMVVFPYIRPPKTVVDSMPADWFLGRSDSGWMKSDVFYEYIANGVNKWLGKNKVKKPVLLFVDGHKTHLTLEISEFCANNDIILYALPPNSTHMMQPADVSVFKPLKSGWKKTVRDWLSQPENINSVVTKSTFCPLLSTVLKENALPETIKNGFRKCGLYPFDPSAVDYSKCLQNAIENLPVNRTKVFTDEFPSTYYEIAERVIQSIAPSLSSKAINPDAIIEEIRKAKSAQSPSTVPDMNEENNAEEIELSANTALDIEPGVYEVDSNGILTATNIIEIEEGLPGPSSISNFVEDASEMDYQDDIILEDSSLVELQSQSSEDFKRDQHTVSPAVDKHLFYPKPIQSKKRRAIEKVPSAISSANWRKFFTDKENEKQEKKLAIAKRREERQQRKTYIELKKKTKRKKRKGRSQPCESDRQEDSSDKQDDEIKIRECCTVCDIILESDEEEYNLKSIGCDKCPRWFHLKCVEGLAEKDYESMSEVEFKCSYCSK